MIGKKYVRDSNISILERNTIYFRLISIILALISVNFLSNYDKNLTAINIFLFSYLVYSFILLYFYSFSPVLFYISLFLDIVLISVMVAIRGGIRSDTYLAYFLALIYSIVKKQKGMVITLCSFTFVCYYIACNTALYRVEFSFKRYLIRMIIAILVTLLLYYVNIEMQKTEDERKKAYKMALIDPLTNVFSRNMMGYVESFHKNNPSEFCLAMLDIDNFKILNDKLGHQTGDKVLELLGETISKNIGNENICIRYGGDEFLIIYTDTNNEKDAYENIEQIRESLNINIYKLIPEKMAITFSSGIALCYPDMTLEDVIYRADVALYNAKANNKNNTIIYDPLQVAATIDVNNQ